MIIEVVAVNVLFLSDLVETNLKNLSEADFLVLNEVMDGNIDLQQLQSYIAFSDVATHTKILHLSVSQSLSYSQSTIPRALIESVNQTLFIWQQAIRESKFPLVEQQLIFSDLAEVELANSTFDTLTMADEALAEISYGPQLSQTLSMIQGATAYKASSCWINGDFTVMN